MGTVRRLDDMGKPPSVLKLWEQPWGAYSAVTLGALKWAHSLHGASFTVHYLAAIVDAPTVALMGVQLLSQCTSVGRELQEPSCVIAKCNPSSRARMVETTKGCLWQVGFSSDVAFFKV